MTTTRALDGSIGLRTLDGEESRLDGFRGRVLLIVNVASHYGFTPQYAGLEDLWRRHRESGLTVLGFPCDQFLHQEPGDEAEIASFCSTRYGVTFPMFAKIDVNGPDTHPLWRGLKEAAPGVLGSRRIKWNFTKFLVDRSGHAIRRFAPSTKPARLESHVLAALGAR